jgi:hypothetical protein
MCVKIVFDWYRLGEFRCGLGRGGLNLIKLPLLVKIHTYFFLKRFLYILWMLFNFIGNSSLHRTDFRVYLYQEGGGHFTSLDPGTKNESPRRGLKAIVPGPNKTDNTRPSLMYTIVRKSCLTAL